MLTLEPFSKDQGRSAVHPKRGSRQLASLRLLGFPPVGSHTCQTPWSVFQDGSKGELAGRRRERARARRHADTARAAIHDHTDDISTGVSKARAWDAIAILVGPRPEPIGGPARAVPHPTGAHRQPPSASLPTISSTL